MDSGPASSMSSRSPVSEHSVHAHSRGARRPRGRAAGSGAPSAGAAWLRTVPWEIQCVRWARSLSGLPLRENRRTRRSPMQATYAVSLDTRPIPQADPDMAATVRHLQRKPAGHRDALRAHPNRDSICCAGMRSCPAIPYGRRGCAVRAWLPRPPRATGELDPCQNGSCFLLTDVRRHP